ncbi:MAG: DUF4267 domain-containing protein [Hyphomonadaceae bacterium]|nr:DUF4267 domain-containing protein [Hyphomonadaceae bacterium]
MIRALNTVTYVVALILLATLLLLSVRGLLDPASAAASFGVTVDDPSAELYQSVYRSRNLIIAGTGLMFLFTGMWRALAVLSTASIALPAFDIYVLKAASLEVAAVHPATLVALVVLSVLLWLRIRNA